jgi:site-specific recombinase XerD
MLSEAAAEWLRYCEHERAIKASTLTEYRHSVDRIIRGLGDHPIEDVTPQMLERWKGTLTCSNRTTAKYLVNLHGIFKRAMKVWGLPRNPVCDVERPRTRGSDDIDAYSPEEVWALVRAAGSDQDAALFLAAAFTGLRMGELLALLWRDVDFTGQVLRVRRSYNIHGGLGTPKSGKVRSVPLVPEVARALARLGERKEFVATTSSCFRTTSAASWTPARCAIATRPRSRPRDYGLSASTTFATPSAPWPSAGPRSRPSRRGWATLTFRRRCATSTTATVATKPEFSRKPSPSLPYPTPKKYLQMRKMSVKTSQDVPSDPQDVPRRPCQSQHRRSSGHAHTPPPDPTRQCH